MLRDVPNRIKPRLCETEHAFCSEDQNLVGLERGLGKFVHRAWHAPFSSAASSWQRASMQVPQSSTWLLPARARIHLRPSRYASFQAHPYARRNEADMLPLSMSSLWNFVHAQVSTGALSKRLTVKEVSRKLRILLHRPRAGEKIMRSLVPSSNLLSLTWLHPERYKWMAGLPRRAWAWELLRRNADYRAAYHARDAGQQPISEDWPLFVFEDPDTDARAANVFWRREACADVLPVVALPEGCEADAGHFLTENLSCRIRVHEEPQRDRLHILFAEGGRALQLEIEGASRLPEAVLVTPVLPPPDLRRTRLQAVRRLNDLMRHRSLRPVHYPREPRGLRLARVVQAFDWAEAGASHREIAVALFGRARVERDWHAAHNPLRDHVRRAIARGRQLTQTGYRQFLA